MSDAGIFEKELREIISSTNVKEEELVLKYWASGIVKSTNFSRSLIKLSKKAYPNNRYVIFEFSRIEMKNEDDTSTYQIDLITNFQVLNLSNSKVHQLNVLNLESISIND